MLWCCRRCLRYTIFINYSPYRVLTVELTPQLVEKKTLMTLFCSSVNTLKWLYMVKAFGLAGIRLGMAMAQEPIIQLMNNVKAPYNINKITAGIASGALDNLSLFRTNVLAILAERDYLVNELKEFPAVTKIFKSDANFILFRIEKSKEIYKQMADQGVVCRYRGTELHCHECLRVTVGTRDENVKFMTLLKQIAKEKGVSV